MQNIRLAGIQRRVRGVTLIETLCVASIVATSVGLAAPSLSAWRHQQALASAAAQLETDIQFARSQAVAMNAPVRLTANTGSDGSCYVVYTGAEDSCSCNPQEGATCTGPAPILRQVVFPANGAVQLKSRSVSLAFDPEHGTVTPATTFKLQAGTGNALHQVVNIMGRVRSCSPNIVPGFKAC
jgi:type IV fimbrial biogenesis protein FimT